MQCGSKSILASALSREEGNLTRLSRTRLVKGLLKDRLE